MKASIIFSLLLFLTIYSCQPTETSEKKAQVANSATVDSELENMIGQMMMIGFRGMEGSEVSATIYRQIEQGYVGGIILFDYDVINKKAVRNIRSPQQVKGLLQAVQAKAPTPLFTAIDQEGGKVNRLKSKYGFPASVSNKYLGTLNQLDSTRHYARINAQNLKELGFNVNFSPCVDTDLNPKNPVIGKYERSYAADPQIVIQHSEAWIQIHDSVGILSTLKHFPGHGSSDADSHEGFTDVTKQWNEKELIPFKEVLNKHERTAIMTAHVFNSQLDSIYPATLSEKVIKGILREDWQYDGLIFSDDLQMKAVNKLFDFETILKRSIEAGVDILVIGNNLEYDEEVAEKAVKAIAKMVREGVISRERIEASYQRIKKTKSTI